jgi:hypothetical protein
MYTYISLEMVYTPVRVRKYVPRYGSTCATPGPSVPEVSSYLLWSRLLAMLRR